MKISINAHSSIQVDNMYFDPFMIDSKIKPAKYVFITHTHYDHLSPEDIAKVIDKNTTIIATPDAKDQLEPLFSNKIIYVKISFLNNLFSLFNCLLGRVLNLVLPF